MKRILWIGNSHLAAIRRAIGSGAFNDGVEHTCVEFAMQDYMPYLTPDPAGGERINPKFAGLLDPLFSPGQPFDAAVSVLAGNRHHVLALLNHPIPFDVFLNDNLGDLPNVQARLIPNALLMEHFRLTQVEEFLTPARLIMARSRRIPVWRRLNPVRLMNTPAGIKPVWYHVQSPPPIPSEAHVRQHPGIFQPNVRTRGISPKPFRHRMWRMQSTVIRQFCEQLGMIFVPVPQSALDEEGFLLEAAWSKDPTHGNVHYGEQVVRQILDLVDIARP